MKNISSLVFLGSALLMCFLVVFVVAGVANGTPSIDNAPIAKRSPAQLYKKYCTTCHGRDGRAQTKKGKFGHARDIADVKWQDDVSDERIFNSIMNGRNIRGNMPAFSKQISDDEADSLVTYVRQLRR